VNLLIIFLFCQSKLRKLMISNKRIYTVPVNCIVNEMIIIMTMIVMIMIIIIITNNNNINNAFKFIVHTINIIIIVLKINNQFLNL